MLLASFDGELTEPILDVPRRAAWSVFVWVEGRDTIEALRDLLARDEEAA